MTTCTSASIALSPRCKDISGVIASVLASSVVDSEFESNQKLLNCYLLLLG